MSITLTKEQKNIVKEIILWLSKGKHTGNNQIKVLAGYAGTGKTTLVTELLKLLPGDLTFNTAVVSYTGKASDVLAAKLSSAKCTVGYVGTLHSLFYTVIKEEENGDVAFGAKGFRRDSSEDTGMAVTHIDMMTSTGPMPLAVSFIVVDELSMIDDVILGDLRRFRVPILLCGDMGQLAPIGNPTAKALAKPNYKLETVHRQALDNPIIKVATDIRTDVPVPWGGQGAEFLKVRNRVATVNELLPKFVEKYFSQKQGTGALLCGKNVTRHSLNNRVRKVLCLAEEQYPQEGETVICLKNDRGTGLKNGTLCTVTKACVPDDTEKCMGKMEVMHSATDEVIPVWCYLPAFGKNITGAQFKAHKDLLFFDFGYALTVHKSQGSEWDAVMLFDQRLRDTSDADYTRWLYTGVTRARKKLIMVS